MATKISFTPTHNFPPRLGNFAKYPQTIPLYPLQPLNVSHRNCNLKAGSGSAAAAKVQALKEDLIESLNSDASADSATASFPSSSKLVLVVGGSGGVGQLVVASLLTRGIKSRLFLRDPEKATALFGVQDNEKLEVLKADTRNSADLDPSMFEGVTHVICTTGTTAFPSRRWDGDNTPERVDWEGVRNLVSALPPSVKRLVLVSSVGVTKFNELPWRNLEYMCLYHSRPGRLTDGPYTSYDLNTLLKATAGERRAVIIGQGDKLVGEASRLVVAEACIQALDIDFTEGNAYEISSVVGEGPGSDPQKWRDLFEAAQNQ
ncbi:unnamed protein product [Linum tenue]|uniref:NAD(P)-binding domain-containing protein n=2 Tax=Linum tenue TaxID=586396 RepID=A0AAV0QAY8_9ROSI|nr:unnamed protein product [Linum tenue]